MRYKTVKCRFNDICRDTIDYTYFYDTIIRADKVFKLSSLFIRSYLLYLFDNNISLPLVTKDFIRTAFGVLVEKTSGGRNLGNKNQDIYDNINKYYEDHFNKKINITEKIPSTNLSYIFGQMHDEFLTSIHNNIKYQYPKHIYRFISDHLQENLTSALDNKKLSSDDIKKIKKNHFNDIKLVYTDIMENTSYHITKYKILNKVRQKIIPLNKTFENILIEDPTILIENMFYINKYFELKKKKMCQAFPIKTTIHLNYVKINTSALVDIFITNNKTEMDISDIQKQVWEKYFNLSKLTLKDHSFNYELSTDGFAVSANFINNGDIEGKNTKKKSMKEGRKNTNKLKKELSEKEFEKLQMKKEEDNKNKIKERNKQKKILINKKKEEFKKLPKEEQDNIKMKEKLKNEFPYIEDLVKNPDSYEFIKHKFKEKNIVCGDPGKRSILYLAGFNKNINPYYRTDRIDDYIYFDYTNKNRVSELKRLKYGQLKENRKNKTKIGVKTMKEIELELCQFNSKSCIYNTFMDYVAKKIEVNNKLYDAYNTTYYRKLNWFSYINKRRHEDNLLNKITKKFGKDIMIVIGDWGGGSGIKYMSTPNIGIRRKLNERFYTCKINEYNTSKLHYKYETECENIEYKIKETPKIKKIIRYKNKKTKEITIKEINKPIRNKPVRKKDEKEKKEFRRLHAVLTYKMEKKVRKVKKTEMGCINRDKNACLNFMKIIKSLVETKERPIKFRLDNKTDKPTGKIVRSRRVHMGDI